MELFLKKKVECKTWFIHICDTENIDQKYFPTIFPHIVTIYIFFNIVDKTLILFSIYLYLEEKQ